LNNTKQICVDKITNPHCESFDENGECIICLENFAMKIRELDNKRICVEPSANLKKYCINIHKQNYLQKEV